MIKPKTEVVVGSLDKYSGSLHPSVVLLPYYVTVTFLSSAIHPQSESDLPPHLSGGPSACLVGQVIVISAVDLPGEE